MHYRRHGQTDNSLRNVRSTSNNGWVAGYVCRWRWICCSDAARSWWSWRYSADCHRVKSTWSDCADCRPLTTWQVRGWTRASSRAQSARSARRPSRWTSCHLAEPRCRTRCNLRAPHQHRSCSLFQSNARNVCSERKKVHNERRERKTSIRNELADASAKTRSVSCVTIVAFRCVGYRPGLINHTIGSKCSIFLLILNCRLIKVISYS